MAVCTPINQTGVYFLTFTCYKWLQLIAQTATYDIFYKWFDLLKERGHSLLGFVLMPNHVHLLLYYKAGERSLNLEAGSAKRFIAYEIVKRLAASGEHQLLDQLTRAVEAKDRSRGKKHEVWENSFDAKECNSEKYILQKLHYIHTNPCAGKWSLAVRSVEYAHSSAAFYAGRKEGYGVRDYLDILVELRDRGAPPSSAKQR